MQQASLDTTYRALADPSRRAMLRQLARTQAQSVSELSAPLSLALPTVLKHIGVLVNAGLVERTKSGRVVTVTLRPDGMAEAVAWLEKTEAFWSTRLDRLARVGPQGEPVTSVTIVRMIEASPEAVFAAFIEPDKLAVWWGPDDGPVLSAEVDPRVGGRFHIRFRLAGDGTEHGSSGTFEVFDPPHRLAMSWAWEDDKGPGSQVDITFRQVDQGTEVTLVHSRLHDSEQRDQHQQGWEGAFNKLERNAQQLR